MQVGMVQNILSKAIKYALFDPTKEMAYIPLDQDTKVRIEHICACISTGRQTDRYCSGLYCRSNKRGQTDGHAHVCAGI